MAAKFFLGSEGVEKFFIFSDSQAALGALMGGEVDSKLVLDVIQDLNRLQGVLLTWVRGHQDCLGNIAADALAKSAARLPNVTHNLPLPRYEIKQQVLGWVRDKWDQEWQAYPLARQTKVFFPTNNPKQAKEVMQLGRRQLGRFLRLITGHNSLQKHCNRVDRGEDSVCRLCQSGQESFLHFLNVCPSLADARDEIFGVDTWLPAAGWDLGRLMDFAAHPLLAPLMVRRRQVGAVGHSESDSDSGDSESDGPDTTVRSDAEALSEEENE